MPPSSAASAQFLTSPPGSLLLVEDDLQLAALLRDALHDVAGEVVWADTAQLARQRLSSQAWDLVVLDAQLPDGDGFDLCRELRSTPSATAVLMLTARASEAERIAGLELGADDYLTKPFNLRELLLRAGNLLRRPHVDTHGTHTSGPTAERIIYGDIIVAPAQRRAWCRGTELSLAPREFDLLAHLTRNADRVFTRSQLLDAIWGARFEGFEHTVNSHINRLRAKIERDPKQPRLLVTVWGSGYRFVATDSTSRCRR